MVMEGKVPQEVSLIWEEYNESDADFSSGLGLLMGEQAKIHPFRISKVVNPHGRTILKQLRRYSMVNSINQYHKQRIISNEVKS